MTEVGNQNRYAHSNSEYLAYTVINYIEYRYSIGIRLKLNFYLSR